VEFVDERPAAHGDADGDTRTTGEYVIPKIIYSDAYYSEMVPMPT
jgi:hypothetical protein